MGRWKTVQRFSGGVTRHYYMRDESSYTLCGLLKRVPSDQVSPSTSNYCKTCVRELRRSREEAA